jgi:hypothetical protein
MVEISRDGKRVYWTILSRRRARRSGGWLLSIPYKYGSRPPRAKCVHYSATSGCASEAAGIHCSSWRHRDVPTSITCSAARDSGDRFASFTSRGSSDGERPDYVLLAPPVTHYVAFHLLLTCVPVSPCWRWSTKSWRHGRLKLRHPCCDPKAASSLRCRIPQFQRNPCKPGERAGCEGCSQPEQPAGCREYC